MLRLALQKNHLNLLILGAHSDDIEIGCGGTLLKLINERANSLSIKWIVFSSNSERKAEAEESAREYLQKVNFKKVEILNFRDGFLPHYHAEIKDYFENLKIEFTPDIIFTHYRADLHQDHRLINELTWNTFRNHLILEYEIPKFDGDLGNPNCYFPLEDAIVEQKCNLLMKFFISQREKKWFTEDLFTGLMRIRGLETNEDERYAEAFYCRKVIVK